MDTLSLEEGSHECTARDIKPIERDGKFYVDVAIEGLEPKRRGPYSSAEEAAAMAERLIQFSRMLQARA